MVLQEEAQAEREYEMIGCQGRPREWQKSGTVLERIGEKDMAPIHATDLKFIANQGRNCVVQNGQCVCFSSSTARESDLS